MKIVSRFDGRTIYECEAETMLACLQAANLYGVNLYGVHLYGANLYGVNLSGANLYGANLSGANLSGADLSGANLFGANLSGANLSGANLYGVNLSGANLYGVNLYGVNLSGANLSGANLYGANLSGKTIINVVQCAGIGSQHRSTVAIILGDEIRIQCGCFSGTLVEFSEKIESTHKNNTQYLAEYRAALVWFHACADAARAAVGGE